jgi:hypothetical protein
MSLRKRSEDGDQIQSTGSLDSHTVADFGAATPVNGQDRAIGGKAAERDSYPGESALPEDRATEAQERDAEKAVADNWHEDPRNPRLWPSHRKWAAAAVVSAYTFVS